MGRLQQSVAGGATTQFLYDGDALVAEYQAGAVTARYVHGPAADNPVIAFAGATASAATASYLIADRQGSIVATANNAGTLGAIQTYDAYGVPNTWSGTRFAYTGQIAIPGAQLYYYKARVYDPIQGRFLQTDPVGYGPDVNGYAYVGNDPVNKGDPTGNHPQYETSNFGQWEDASDGTDDSPLGQLAQRQANAVATSSAFADAVVAQVKAILSGGGQVGPANGSGYSTLSPDRTLEQQKADFNDPRLNGIPEAEQQEAIGMGATIAAGIAAGVAVVAAGAAPEVAAATGRALGPRGNVFGRQYLGGRAIFTGKNFSLGWGWNGPKGVEQLRLSGKWIDAIKGEKHAHIDLPLTLDKW